MRVRVFRPGQDLPVPCVAFVNVSWCPHCHAARPAVADAAARLGSALPVVGIDADAHHRLVRRWGVDGYPAIVFVGAGGSRAEYTGDRTGKAIADWACQMSGRCAT